MTFSAFDMSLLKYASMKKNHMNYQFLYCQSVIYLKNILKENDMACLIYNWKI